MGRGWSVQCGMLGYLFTTEPCKACRVFCWTRHVEMSIFFAWCLQISKTKTVLVWLTFPINAHQNAVITNTQNWMEQCVTHEIPMKMSSTNSMLKWQWNTHKLPIKQQARKMYIISLENHKLSWKFKLEFQTSNYTHWYLGIKLAETQQASL